MIIPSGAVRVLVATRPVDFRNYAECTIMLSGWRQTCCRHLAPDVLSIIF